MLESVTDVEGEVYVASELCVCCTLDVDRLDVMAAKQCHDQPTIHVLNHYK